jgi:uncharacterized protein (DUF488 family)
MALFTIGYESITVHQLVDELHRHRIRTVIDVRQNPVSRKPGFSRMALSDHLQHAGMHYEHAAIFGCPRVIRDDYKVNGDWTAYQIEYAEHLQMLDADLVSLARRALRERCILLCFEANPLYCHRSLVAARAAQLVNNTLLVTHLVTTAQAQAARRYDRQALAAGNTRQ